VRRLRLWLARWLCAELFAQVTRLERELRMVQVQMVRRRATGEPAGSGANGRRDARLFSREVRQYTDDRGPR
jgi:hypothetical protein